MIGERRLLLVIDDVWDAAHLTPFLQGGRYCARLVTTRNRSTVPASAETVAVDAMQPDEAVAVLGAGLPAGEEAALASLAVRLGEWPLLLKLANAQLRERVLSLNEPLPVAIDRVGRALTKRGIIAFDVENANERGQAVAATLRASLAFLGEGERSRFAELAVFPEDAWVPLAAVETLWAATADVDDLDCDDLFRKLFRLSLLLDLDLAQRRLRLHDVVRAYLLPAGEEQHRALHLALVEAYRARCGGAWPSLPDDGHVFANLLYHLFEAGLRDELRALLLDCGWLVAKLRATTVQALIADCDLLPEGGEIRLLQGALRLSIPALMRDPGQLAAHLIGRLRRFEEKGLRQLCSGADASAPPEAWFCPKGASLQPPGGPLLQTFAGHTGGVLGAAVLDGGARALSWTRDGTLRLWDLASGRSLQTLEGHTGTVEGAVVLGGGARAVSWSEDWSLILWDLGTGKALARFIAEADITVALAAAQNLFVAGAANGTVHILELREGDHPI